MYFLKELLCHIPLVLVSPFRSFQRIFWSPSPLFLCVLSYSWVYCSIFNFHVFVSFPNFFPLLVSSFLPLCPDNILCMTLNHLNVWAVILWPRYSVSRRTCHMCLAGMWRSLALLSWVTGSGGHLSSQPWGAVHTVGDWGTRAQPSAPMGVLEAALPAPPRPSVITALAHVCSPLVGAPKSEPPTQTLLKSGAHRNCEGQQIFCCFKPPRFAEVVTQH